MRFVVRLAFSFAVLSIFGALLFAALRLVALLATAGSTIEVLGALVVVVFLAVVLFVLAEALGHRSTP